MILSFFNFVNKKNGIEVPAWFSPNPRQNQPTKEGDYLDGIL